MSINHYSSESTPQPSLWWSTHQQQQQQQQPSFNLNNQVELEEDDDVTPEEEVVAVEDEEEKEAMFEKALTPSDVGKLNRLVIPKQHAEKYFPLGGGDSVVEETSNKGLLLSFEDESGKCWRFRYSYWNSSQSYVLTKGWSRYVKDKRLDAGDVVLFLRHRSHPNRLFISWRRRHHSATGSTTAQAHISSKSNSADGGGNSSNNGNNGGAGFGVGVPMGWTRGYYPAHPYPMHHHHPFPYQHDSLHAGGGSQGQNETTAGGNVSSSRVLRLFGVNMECQPDENDSQTLRSEFSSYNNNTMSSNQGTHTHHFYHHQPPSSSSSSSNPHHHMLPQQPH